MVYLFLASAILSEVGATLTLKVASTGRSTWYIATTAGYVLAFAFLSLALAGGMGLGVAYGIWAAAGVAVTALASRVLFKEPFTRLMAGGITLIVLGVLLIEFGATH
ncbi:SMR family transporter [Nocardioides sp. NPDC127503]|uniref:DMT family transporter n=1 Tax=Nocardioides sp. NPDC127503 TaxID=3154516 RepID=UPI0033207ECA